jgi:hypothetical protein
MKLHTTKSRTLMIFSLKVLLAHFRSKRTDGFSPLSFLQYTDLMPHWCHSKTRLTKKNIFKQRLPSTQ